MFSRLKQIGLQSFFYGLGGLLPNAIGFLLIPIYTQYLGPSDYGILSVASTLTSILLIFLQFGLGGAVTRFHYDYVDDNEELTAYYGTIWIFLTVVAITFGALFNWYGEAIFSLLFTQIPYQPYGQLTLGIACFSVAATIPMTLFRVREQAYLHTSFSIARFLLLTVGIIYLVTVLSQGAKGSLRAQLWIAALFFFPYTIISLRNLRLVFHVDKLKDSLAFGLPLIPHQLSGWALTVSDRVLLERIVSLDQLGLYSLGYRFGNILDVIASSINMAWAPFFYRIAATDEDAPYTFARLTTYYTLSMLSFAMLLALCSKEIIILVANPAFHEAYQIVPIIVLASLLHGVYFIAVNPLFFVKQTKKLPLYTLASAIINIAINLIALPRFGIVAAAWSTVVGFALSAILVFRESNKVYPIPYEYGRLAQLSMTSLGLFALGYLVNTGSIYLDLFCKLFCVVLFPVALWLQRFFLHSEKEQFKTMVRKFKVSKR